MCTIIAIHREGSLTIGANRDEFYARPSLAPQVLEPGIVGGRDVVARGTWLGLTPRGLFVAVTNQRTLRPPDPVRHSRGELVLEALRAGSIAGIVDRLRSIDGRGYNPFNLLFGDGTRLLAAYAREERDIAIEELAPGVIVLANDRIGALEYPKTQRAEMLLRNGVPLENILADHQKHDVAATSEWLSAEMLRELQALCIHTPQYGTRSSAIVELAPGVVRSYRHAEGPPCTTPFVEFTALLR
jgi:uncharacterized protein with NRDE domain